MQKNRIEAFSDGVLAIAITIMVLELRPPHGSGVHDLQVLAPIFLSYVLSFVYVAIYWNNHHHMFQVVQNIDGRVLWANMLLLFWLSLTPFVTAWAGENEFSALPVAAYGFVLLMASISYYLLSQALIRINGRDSVLARAVGADSKGKISTAIYLMAIPVAFYQPWISIALYVAVAVLWFVPDRRIERRIQH